MQDAAEERPDAGDRAAVDRAPAAGQLAGVREPLRVRHAMPAAIAVARPAMNAYVRLVRDERDREDRRERRQRAVDQADHGGLDALEEERLLLGHE